MGGNEVLLLTTLGRKSGKAQTTPLSYFNIEDGYLIVASNGGSATHPDWYHNLTAEPEISVQLGGDHLKATATTAEGEERDRLWDFVTGESKWYAGYQEKTTRVIPLVKLMTDWQAPDGGA